MGVRILSIVVLMTFAGAAGATDISKSYAVAPGGVLDIDSEVGSIEVMPGEDGKVIVDVDLSGPDADRLEVKFEQTPDGVSVRARLQDSGRRNSSHSLRARFRARVPSNYNLRLDTAGGDIDVGDLNGEVLADTAGGSISIGRVEGPVRADTAGGGIDVEACRQDLDADTAGASGWETWEVGCGPTRPEDRSASTMPQGRFAPVPPVVASRCGRPPSL